RSAAPTRRTQCRSSRTRSRRVHSSRRVPLPATAPTVAIVFSLYHFHKGLTMTDTHDSQTPNPSAGAAEGADAPATRAESASSEPDDIAPPLGAMIASIRSAVAPSASPQARTAGASACRSILTVLEAKPGQPL